MKAYEFFQHLVWLEQPMNVADVWRLHAIRTFRACQLVGVAAVLARRSYCPCNQPEEY